MRFWQASWDLRGQFLIWGESGQALEAAKSLSTSFEGASPAHPFCCSIDKLKEDLSLLDFVPTETGTAEFTLPSDKFGPLVSPDLQALTGVERDSRDFRARGWEVPVIIFEPVEALNLLSSLPEDLPQGLRMDDSMRFWREATKLLLEFLSRGCFVPGIFRDNGRFLSKWYVVPREDADRNRLSILSRAMPAVCTAFVQNGLEKNVTANILLESFISKGVDSLIRTFLKSRQDTLRLNTAQITPRTASYANWLFTLFAENAEVVGVDYELAKLESRLRRWSGGLIPLSEAHELSTIFNVKSPQNSINFTDEESINEVRWTIEFGLQSKTVPGQTLFASEIWQGEKGFLTKSDFSQEDLEDILLRDLGRASSLFSPLERALNELHPKELKLTTAEVYEFIKDVSGRLIQSGITVILPDWWQRHKAKFGLHLHVNQEHSSDLRSKGGSYFLASEQLLDFSWKITVADQELTLESFEQLVKSQVPLLEINGQWVELEPAKVKATLDFLRKQQEQPRLRLVDALRFGFGFENDESVLPVVGFSASGWLERLIHADSHQLDTIQAPTDFKGELRKYQLEGLSWLGFLSQLGIGGCLADDMGLGKTIQLLTLLLYEREEALKTGAGRLSPTLLIVPMSIIANWEREARKFAPTLSVYIHHGAQRFSGQEFLAKAIESDLVITTYSLSFRDEATIAEVPWGRIALDEAQNIKNLETKQTKAIRRIATQKMRGEFGCQRVALTGTPLENHLEELWSIFDFLNPGFLGTLSDFRTRFVLPIERFRDKEASAKLSKLLHPFVLRRLKTDPKIISDLPEKIEMEVYVPLTKEQASLYQATLDTMLPAVESASGIHRKGLVLGTITRLKQICNHPLLLLKDGSAIEGRSVKVSRLEQLLEELLAEGDKALIFTQFAQMGHLLKPYLQEKFGVEVLFLHGALSKSARDKIVEKFQQQSGPPIFILSLKAGGFGLNLTEANQVIHLDQWWNPAVGDQATDRAYRIGQKRNVQVRKMICQGTLEEKIAALLKHKKELADEIVGTTKNFVTQLSADELRDLLRLTPMEYGTSSELNNN